MNMNLKSIKQIILGFICFTIIAFSSLGIFTSSAIASSFEQGSTALAEVSPLAAAEDMAEDATSQMEEMAEDAQKSVEEGVENATQKAEETKEAVEDNFQGDEQASNEEGGGIIEKVKSLFTGE